MQSSSPCGHTTRKHHFLMHSSYPGHFAVLQCKWTLCQAFKTVDHQDLVKAMVA